MQEAAKAIHDDAQIDDARTEFIEALGFLVEGIRWMPRMTGRVLGCLLVADGPLTQADLRDQLDASLGAVSTATRTLLDKRFALRVSIPGNRQTGLIIHPDAWRNMEEDGIAGVQSYAQLALNTLESLEGEESPATANLQKMNDYFVEVEKRMRGIMQWFDEQKKLER